jgi:hypothetical protein
MDRDFVKFLGAFVLGVTLLVGGIAAGSNTYTKYRCNQYERITGAPTKYSNFDTCYVKVDNTWQRWDEYLLLNTGKNSLENIKVEVD